MKLDEILAKHPELNAEIQGLVKEAVAEVMATEGAKNKKVSAVISGDYPDQIKAFAGKVLDGETGPDALDVLLTLHETNKAQAKQETAMGKGDEEGEQAGEELPPNAEEITPPSVKSKVEETGVCESNEDFDALLKMEAE